MAVLGYLWGVRRYEFPHHLHPSNISQALHALEMVDLARKTNSLVMAQPL